MRRPPPPGSSSSRRPVKLTPAPTPRERPPLTAPHPGPATEPPQLGGVRSSRAAALRSESPGQAPAHSSLSPGAAPAPGARQQPRLRRAEVSSVSFLPGRQPPWGPPPRSLGSFAAALWRWRRLRERQRVHAVRGCGPVLALWHSRPRGRGATGGLHRWAHA